MRNLNPVGKLAQFYEEQPIFQAIGQLAQASGIPFLGTIDVLLKGRANEIAKERAVIFFDELSKTHAVLTPDVIQSEDFVHRFVITAQAALNTRRREKIRQFARLLTSSFHHEKGVSTDEYEEYLGILDDLSLREFSVLVTLDEFMQTYPAQEGENEIVHLSRFWEEFLIEAEQIPGVNEGEANAILGRLNRTGCYVTYTKMALGYSGDQGNLTPIYFKLKALLNQVEEHH